jgi:TonB-linked SusC/RagA family outer membrane protein
VLRSIEQQTNYRFLYNYDLEDIHDKVSLNVKDAAINDVMNLLLGSTNLLYQLMNDNLIVIKEDPNVLVDVVIRGKVTGEGGTPLLGASVQIKGTNVGTSTNADGNFSITAANANVTLVISSVGYDIQEIALGGRTEVDVSMKLATKVMDQVVVIGYGTASKRDLTGSIVKVSGKEVQDKPNTNPVSSLQGKVAGLSVVNSGTPGAQPDIRIRGTVSIGQVHPLYVVDGIFNDNIDYLNPNDIESIEILKDPSSLAIFGVKGATGVIAITTKRAKAGQVTVNFNTSYGFKKLVDKIKLANAQEFKTLFDEERTNNGFTDPYDYSGLDANTDWIDAVTQTGNFSANNISVSGSSERNRFQFGAGYTYDEGIIRHEKLERITVALADELKLNKFIKMGINFNASRQDNPYDATWVLDAARKVIPLVSSGTKNFYVKNPYGTDSLNMDIYSALDVGLQSAGVINPLVTLENEWDKTINREYRTVGSFYLDINFLKYFTFRPVVYADVSTVNKRVYTPLYYSYNPRTLVPSLASQTTRVTEDDRTWRKFQQDYVLTFKRNFGDHGVTATAGFTTYYFGNFNRYGRSSQANGPTALPIPDDERFWYITNGFQDPSTTSASSDQSEYSTVSYLARVLYNYKNKYFLNGSFRDDASSRLPEANRHQQFWAIGAAWDLSKEDFMQNQRIFDFLKVKGSVGVLGNQTASRLDGSPLNYPFYPNLNTGSNAVFGTNVYTAADPEYIPNPDLKWETVQAWELGVELNAFQNR